MRENCESIILMELYLLRAYLRPALTRTNENVMTTNVERYLTKGSSYLDIKSHPCLRDCRIYRGEPD